MLFDEEERSHGFDDGTVPLGRGFGTDDTSFLVGRSSTCGKIYF